MSGRNIGITVKFTPQILAQIDHLVDDDLYASRSDFIQLSVLYSLQKERLIREVKNEIIDEIKRLIENRSITSENEIRIRNLVMDVVRQVMEEQNK